METIDTLDLDLAPGRPSDRPPCECVHGDEEERCCDEAEFRVTVLCAAVDCTDAAGVYLLCGECLEVWDQQWVRTGELDIRVRPL